MQKLTSNRTLLLSLVVVMAFIVVGLVASQVFVQAEYGVGTNVYAWDVSFLGYQNSNVVIRWDGAWVPFLHNLNVIVPTGGSFSEDPYTPTLTCDGTSSTKWAGLMEYGVYHVDNSPLGAPGFTTTRRWSYADCDRDGDLDWDVQDRRWTGYNGEVPPNAHSPIFSDTFPMPPTYTHEMWLGYIPVITINQPVSCTTGNCLLELVTTLEINLDEDCDGNIDPKFLPPTSSGQICFYAEAKTPIEEVPTWQQTLQGRVGSAGGERTVSFAPVGPTGVDMGPVRATAWGGSVLVEWVTYSEVDNLGFNLFRAESVSGPQTQVNGSLIAVIEPGSPLGHVYSFLDQSVAADGVYYYWLEEVDVDDVATLHGPFPVYHRIFLPVTDR
jgi:hypothetical protein